MKTNLVRAALVCAALLTATTAVTAGKPILGVDVIVRKMCGDHPCGGALTVHKTTKTKGSTAAEYTPQKSDGSASDIAVKKSTPTTKPGKTSMHKK